MLMGMSMSCTIVVMDNHRREAAVLDMMDRGRWVLDSMGLRARRASGVIVDLNNFILRMMNVVNWRVGGVVRMDVAVR